MTALVLTNARIFAGGCDLTSQSNKVEIGLEVEDKDKTTFGSGGAKERLGGLFDSTISATGFWQAGDASMVDDQMWAALGGSEAWSVTPDGATVGTLAYLTQALQSTYKLGDAVGEVAPWESEAKGNWPVTRGVIAHPPGTARTSTGTGTGQQLGAVSSTQYLYAAAHILSVAGTSTPTITLAIESAPDNTFASPTTRASFTAATAVGDQIVRTAGAITDTWWRPKWTISGTSPSFLFVVSFGIK